MPVLLSSHLLSVAMHTFVLLFSEQIAKDSSGSKGYGFVHFETEKAAQQAIDKVNGMLLNGRKASVSTLFF